MVQMIKTTVTIPEDLLQMAKIKAVQEKITLSQIIRDGIQSRVKITPKSKKSTKKPDFMKHLGVFKIGIQVPYKHRSDLYEEHLKRKMGY